MTLPNYFRALLCIFTLLVVAEIASDVLTVQWLPDPLRQHVEARMNNSELNSEVAVLLILSLAALALMVASVVGLWVFWRPARLLYTLFLLVFACAIAASGTIVQTALTSVLSFMYSVIAGVILGMIYFSPLRDLFEASSEDRPT
jgi:hypothetical protein